MHFQLVPFLGLLIFFPKRIFMQWLIYSLKWQRLSGTFIWYNIELCLWNFTIWKPWNDSFHRIKENRSAKILHKVTSLIRYPKISSSLSFSSGIWDCLHVLQFTAPSQIIQFFSLFSFPLYCKDWYVPLIYHMANWGIACSFLQNGLKPPNFFLPTKSSMRVQKSLL